MGQLGLFTESKKKCIDEDKPRVIWCYNIGNESEDKEG
jgi:hypothetical protein